MSGWELLRAVLFVGAVGAVFAVASGSILRFFLERRGKMSPPPRWRRWLRRANLGLAGIGLLCFGYGGWIEPYRLTVTRVTIPSPKVSNPVRILHISDLHCDPAPRLEEALPGAVEAESPDLIVFTGDAINSPEGLPIFRTLMGRLSEIAPVFAVRGNWGAFFFPKTDLYGGTGVRELDGEGASLRVGASGIWVAGASPGRERLIEPALRDGPDGAFKLLLYHYPDEIEERHVRGADLYCAGHTHGGQVALPLYGALVTLSKHGKRYESGLYRHEETWLYVNRGIGMEGGGAPRVRFCAPPEVTVITVEPAS